MFKEPFSALVILASRDGDRAKVSHKVSFFKTLNFSDVHQIKDPDTLMTLTVL